MDIIGSIAILFLIAWLIISMYLVKRNEWVLRKRLEILDESLEDFTRLPSYEYMLYRRFWIWNFENLKTRKNINEI